MLLCGLVVVGGILALGFGFAPWLILMGAFCLLMMGSMLWMMVGMGTHTMHGSEQGRWISHERPLDKEEGPVDILERRFAEGAITPEDYQARRKLLNGTAEPNGHRDKPLTVPQGAERRR
jgi:uncharacterized membrane protein